jgi:hypothetical protein
MKKSCIEGEIRLVGGGNKTLFPTNLSHRVSLSLPDLQRHGIELSLDRSHEYEKQFQHLEEFY